MKILNMVVNIFRSVPFLILMIMVLPLSQVLFGTRIGTIASLLPLVIAAAPFVARMVEGSLREVDQGVLEAAQAMGCSPWQIITKVMLPESRPSLISGATIALTTILSYSAMAGAIGGGGLGKVAINYGMYRFRPDVMLLAVILLILLVQIFQSVGTWLAVRCDKRLTRSKKGR
jgi:D-methionine transport system permease protein